MNTLNKTDAYKLDHRSQYPAGTELVFSNWTPRSSRIEGIDEVILFGLQAYLINLEEEWKRDFFDQPRDKVVFDYAKRVTNAGISIDYDHILQLHDLGHLPLEIWALPEGAAVPIGVPMFVMWNTEPEFFWLTNYLETSMSSNVWGPCTSATLARRYREILEFYAYECGADRKTFDFVDVQAHDFSYRGMYGDKAAAMSGAAHLLYFNGTDTIPALDFVEKYYNVPAEGLGGSVPATEHSVMCMGTKDDEIETFRRLITEVYPTGIVSIVSDTWDYWKVWTEILPALKDDIMARDGKVVIRPDSGDPVKIITGDPDAPVGSPAFKGSMRLAFELFGGVTNETGFTDIDPHIGLIYGDSITHERCEKICVLALQQGFTTSAMVFGVGSYTFQYVTRDTFGFALKSTAGIVDGEVREIFKDPVTDDGTKKSAKGFTAVYKEDGRYVLKDGATLDDVRSCEFIRVYHGKQGVHARCNFTRMRHAARGEV